MKELVIEARKDQDLKDDYGNLAAEEGRAQVTIYIGERRLG